MYLTGLSSSCASIVCNSLFFGSTSQVCPFYRYGEQAGEITNEGLGAAGHAIGTAWAVFKIRKALNPKSAVKPTTLAKSAVKAAAADLRAKKGK